MDCDESSCSCSSYEEEEEEYDPKIILSNFFHCTYRQHSNKMLATMFCKYGPSLEKANALPYNDLVTSYRKERLAAVTSSMLLRIIHLLNWNRCIFLPFLLCIHRPSACRDLILYLAADGMIHPSLAMCTPGCVWLHT